MASVGKRETFVSEDSDNRSSVSIGMDWGTRITSIGLEFALPAVLGFGLDRWLGTSPWLTLTGAFLGMAAGMLHVLRLATTLSSTPGKQGRGRKPTRPAGGDDLM